jgi:hypothetical protein
VNGKNGEVRHVESNLLQAQPLYLHASFNEKKKENLEKNCTKKTDLMLHFHKKNEGFARTWLKKSNCLEWKWKNVIITFKSFNSRRDLDGFLNIPRDDLKSGLNKM